MFIVMNDAGQFLTWDDTWGPIRLAQPFDSASAFQKVKRLGGTSAIRIQTRARKRRAA
jgi:hypothetical protein